MAIAKIDFLNGIFILCGHSAEMRLILLAIGITVLCVLATLCFTLKERLKLFLNLSICCVIIQAVWFSVGLATEGLSYIPIKGSMPIFREALQEYLRGILVAPILHIIAFIISFLYFIAVMCIILVIKKGYKQITTYFAREK
ncbi:hypothetical protein Ga0466249_001509 [Sporomusaceae bacterium BoRhaA]|uniref:hypothetical protein n=1 Tax=Pelorhabdus rhamnosifermentans TaxID=2772457 RepID=UPI001C063667|nr:hypothetical protein [Pelorhabdus rhamnosifermentans]MBU2700417.1 hypothetical protein [Pelorhabdus rhamnosifermentans]